MVGTEPIGLVVVACVNLPLGLNNEGYENVYEGFRVHYSWYLVADINIAI